MISTYDIKPNFCASCLPGPRRTAPNGSRVDNPLRDLELDR